MFDITSVLKGAPGNGQEQIVYLDLDLLDPDERNFYSLEGLDELAGNIELLGLQQPLRVRPGEGGHYTIVSGHRRRAACMLIRDGGSEMFAGGVPCIVEYGEASEAMQELRLIYANAATRVMGPAEISKQAERVEALLYELKEKEGIEFPGRMRDHVAQACKVSKSKIARLHAIRKNLEPRLLEYFDRGELAEETAYQLQRLPAGAQIAIADHCDKRKSATWFLCWQVENAAKKIDLYMNPNTGKVNCEACTHREARFLQAMLHPYASCDGGCCLKCPMMDICKQPCERAAEKRNQKKTMAKAEQAEADKARQKAAEERENRAKEERRKTAQRLLPLIEAAGLKDNDELPNPYPWNQGTEIASIRKQADGNFKGVAFYRGEGLLPNSVETLCKWADVLGCSLDYMAGRSETPQPVSGSGMAGGWGRGLPPKPGEYLAVLGVGQEETPQASFYRVIQWTKSEGWCHCRSHAPIKETIFRWLQLPEV